MQHGTFQLMKSVNRSIVLNKIRVCEPISRAQIAKETDLTPPTVSSIVRELLSEGMLVEKHMGISKGGRKPTMLYINHDAYYIIGVDVGPRTIKTMLTNLGGEIIARFTCPLTLPITNQLFLDKMIQSIYHVFDSVENRETVIGIGVAMHGVVDVENGYAVIAPNLGLHYLPVKKELEHEFQIQVKMDNDARVMALGETWFGQHTYQKDMLFVNIGHGVGSGLVVGGKAYHGANDIAGEVGHMTIDRKGEACSCGNKGCLQTLITGPSIAKRAGKKTGVDVYNGAINRDKKCLHVLTETGEIIGIALTNLIHLLNPELIILGGGVLNAEQFLLPVIKQTITSHVLTSSAQRTTIKVTNLGENAALLGAIALFLEEVFHGV